MKRIRFYNILITLSLANTLIGFGQTNDKTKTLTGDYTNLGIDLVEARDWVKLDNTFSFTAATDKTITIRANESLVCDADYLIGDDIPDAEEHTIVPNLPVGSILGQASVSPTGGAVYQVPIVTPPGTAGMTPNVSLAYNSQGGNGLMGAGWSISGLSAIVRTSQNHYHEGYISGVNFDDNDRFVLDGNRLILVSGTYGANGSEYRTENETFMKVTLSGSGTAQYFTVETKDGKTLKYGRILSTKVVFPGKNRVYSWHLDMISDKNDNYIELKYTQENGEIRIEEINYTGNSSTGISPYNKIKFYYDERTDVNSFYIGGGKIERKHLLRQIKAFSEEELQKHYEFKYSDVPFSKLHEMVEYSPTGNELNSTVFNWENISTGYDMHETVSNPIGRGKIFGDFNGDGKIDMLMYTYRSDGNHSSADKWRVYLGTWNKTFTFFYEGSLTSGFNGFVIGDFDEDGDDDIQMRVWKEHIETVEVECPETLIDNGAVFDGGVVANVIEPPDPDKCYESYSWMQNDFLFYHVDENTVVRDTLQDFVGNREENDIVKNADFDGDGDLEYLFLDQNQTYRTIYGLLVSATEYFNSPDFIRFIDFNGNGKTDILVVKGNDTEIFEYNGSSLDVIFNSTSLFKSWHRRRIFGGDFNGDGLSDFLSFDEDYKWYFYLSDGTTFIKSPMNDLVGNLNSDALTHNYAYSVADMNGDGLSDVLEAQRISTGNQRLTLFKNYSMNFETETHEIQTSDFFEFVHFFDIDGDGIKELIWKQGWMEPYKILSFDINEPRYINAVANGMGLFTKFSYSLNPLYSVCDRGDSEIFPEFSNHTLNTGFVENIQHYNGSKLLSYQEYNYTNAIIHRKGKGFLGFEEVKVNDIIKKVEITNKYKFNHTSGSETFYFPAIYESVKKVNGTLAETTTATYDVKNFSETVTTPSYERRKRFFGYLKNNTIVNSITGITNTNSFEYDDFGNLTEMTSNAGNDAEVTVTNTYQVAGAWCKSKLQSSTSVNKYKTEADFTVTATNTYFTDGNLETSTSNGVTKSSTYDDYGNVLTATISGTDAVSSIVTNTYDSKGRFLKEVKNSQNQVEKYTPDLMGRTLIHESIDGNKEYFEYDDFGKLKKATSVDGQITNYTYDWAPENDFGGLYYIYTTREGMPYQRTYYDILGRVVKAETDSYNGAMAAEKSYNTKGLLEEETYPYLVSQGSTSVPKVTYGYDDYGRPINVTDNGFATTMSYTGNTVTTTLPSGEIITNTYDATGKTTEITDNGGTLTYNYFSHGQVKNIQAPGSTVSMGYDANGFQSSLTDPDAGSFGYNCNALGQLKSQVNSNGTQSMTYDNLGRINVLTTPDGTYTHSYIASGNGIGQIDQITQSGNVLEDYDYDDLGRVVRLTEKVGDITLATEYGYDSKGRLSTIDYPENFGIEYVYDNIGTLTEIKTSDNTTVWRLESINNDGQLEQFSYGNGLYTTLGYDSKQLLNSLTTGTIQSLAYTFDGAKGRLLDRTGLVTSKQEVFSYDSQNQLTGTTSSSMTALNQNVTYDNSVIGNITTKSDVGDYRYGEDAGPHAITKILNPSATLSSLPNQSIEYTWFNKVEKIQEGNFVVDFTYGLGQQRTTMEVKENGTTKRKVFYSGSYERHVEGSTIRHLYYIPGPNGLAAIYKKENGTGEMFYVHTDHLGSLHTISGEDKSVKAKYYYDAWGMQKELNTSGTAFITSQNLSWLHRGYTSHELIEEVGLINMNGRVYDPLLGRMLSPDNNITYPNVTHNYNRYSYALNNPLVFSDPDGDNPLLILAGAIIWASSLPMKDYALNHGNEGLYKLSQGMNIAGSTMMSFGFGGIGGPVGFMGLTMTGGMTSGMNGEDPIQGMAQGAAWAMLPSAIDYYGQKLGQQMLFNSPIGTKEALSGTINRSLDFSFEFASLSSSEMAVYGGMVSFASSVGDMSTHFIYEDITPEIYEHTENALREHPEWSELTYNGGGLAARKNRYQALKNFKVCGPGNSRDEFPYATTYQGGTGAKVRCVPESEQYMQAGMLRALYRGLDDGDNFRVVLVPSGGKVPETVPFRVPEIKPFPIIPVLPELAPILVL